MKKIVNIKVCYLLIMVFINLSTILMSQQLLEENKSDRLGNNKEYEIIMAKEVSPEGNFFLPDKFFKLNELIKSNEFNLSEEEIKKIKDYTYETKEIANEVFALIDNEGIAKDRFQMNVCYSKTNAIINKQDTLSKEENIKIYKTAAPNEIINVIDFYEKNRELFISLFNIMEKHDIFGIAFSGSEISDFFGVDHGWLPMEPFVIFKRGSYFYLHQGIQTLLYVGPVGSLCEKAPDCYSCFVEGDPRDYCVGLVKSKCKGLTSYPLFYSEVYGRSKKNSLVYMMIRIAKNINFKSKRWLLEECPENLLENNFPQDAGIRIRENYVIRIPEK